MLLTISHSSFEITNLLLLTHSLRPTSTPYTTVRIYYLTLTHIFQRYWIHMDTFIINQLAEQFMLH